MLAQGSRAGNASPFCSNSIEIRSGERTNAMRPSRGGRLITTPRVQQALASCVDIVDLIGQVTEVACAAVFFGIPVPGEFHLGALVTGRRQEHQRESARLAVATPQFDQAQLAAIEVERGIQVADTNHGMQVFHCGTPLTSGLPA
jgi:hypothetical protein